MNTFGFDANKGITKIEYDLLGNPKKISFADRSYIDYVYSADGRRIKTRHFTAVPSSATLSLGQASTLTSSQIQSVDSTEYIGNFVFENNTFKQYHFDGGYITSSGFPTNYKYYVKDHLGNNRILASYNGTVEQTTHYYPFGGTHHFSSNQGVQKYKYNGKELDTMHGLNWYDYGARQYDPAIGQFTSMDPLCEKYYHISPYAYCGGNPVKRIDPNGMDWYERNGQRIWQNNVNETYIDKKGNEWNNIGHTFTDKETGMYYSLFGQKYPENDINLKAIKIVDRLVLDFTAGIVERYSCDFRDCYKPNKGLMEAKAFYYGIEKEQLEKYYSNKNEDKTGKNANVYYYNNIKANIPTFVSCGELKICGLGNGVYGAGIEIGHPQNQLNFYATFPIPYYNKNIHPFLEKLHRSYKK